jgi:predicted nuclease of predicted toxin-antitoxin system
MKILFDQGVPKKLRRHLLGHEVCTAYEAGLSELENGALLRQAQTDFDILITTDSNIRYQQRLPDYDIALIALRAFTNALEDYLPLVPQIMNTLDVIEPGQVVYLYADERLRIKDEAKGK